MRNLLFLGVAVAVMGVQACARDQPSEGGPVVSNPLVGAWLVVHTSVTDASGTKVDESPEPGLYLFTEHHFTNMLIPGTARAPFSPERTHDERLTAYDNFIADGGTYEYTASTLTANNIIAKVPNAMPPHRSTEGLSYGWRLDGEELVLTLRGGWAPSNGEIIYRLARLE